MRLSIREGRTGGRHIEGIVVDLLEGRDGRARLRLAIPTGSGDPVEIRVLLDSVTSVENIEDDSASASTTISGTRAVRTTLGFGEGDFAPAPAVGERSKSR